MYCADCSLVLGGRHVITCQARHTIEIIGDAKVLKDVEERELRDVYFSMTTVSLCCELKGSLETNPALSRPRNRSLACLLRRLSKYQYFFRVGMHPEARLTQVRREHPRLQSHYQHGGFFSSVVEALIHQFMTHILCLAHLFFKDVL